MSAAALFQLAYSPAAIHQRMVERASRRRRDEPEELALWRILIEYRNDLRKAIVELEVFGPKHAAAAAKARLKATGSRTEATREKKAWLEGVRLTSEACAGVIAGLDARIAARPKKTVAPHQLVAEMLAPRLRQAVDAMESYIKTRDEDSKAAALMFLYVVSKGPISRPDVDRFIQEARAWRHENAHSGRTVVLARYVVAKVAGLPPTARELR